MLSFFRKLINSKVGIIVTFVALGVIALAFAAGDVRSLSGAGRAGAGGPSAVEVGNADVDATDLRQRAQAELEAAQAQQPTLTMPQFVAGGGFEATVERAINGLALEVFGHDQGMVVSKRSVDGQIASIPALQGPTGKFDQKIYERLLAERHLSDHIIRGDIARDTLGQQLTVPTAGATQVPQDLALPYASLLLEKRSGTIGFIPARAMGAGATPTAAELQTYYQRNVARYTLPERRVIRYALVTPDSVKAQAAPTDAEIAQAYQANGAQYAASQQRDVTQVVVLDEKAATALAAKVKGGMSIEAAAKAAGLEPQTLKGVTKDGLTRQTSAPLADAVFGAAQGVLVGPVRGAVGYVVARVTGIHQVPGKTLEQARVEIAKVLTAQKTQAALGKVHDKLDDAISNNATFAELMSDNKLSAQATPAVTATGVDPLSAPAQPDPNLAQVVAAGFQAEQGDDPQFVTVGADGGFAVVALDRVVPAAPQPLAKVRDVVVRDFTANRAQQAAHKVATGVLAKVNGGMKLAQALHATGLPLPPTQPLAASRAQLAAAPGGASPPLALMFSMVDGSAKMLEAPNQSGWLLIHLDRVDHGDAAGNPRVVAATRQDLGRAVGQEYVQQFVEAVKKQVGVKRNDATIAQVRGDLTGQGGSDQP